MINIGLIGLGGMARNHLQRLREIPEAKTEAGTDPDPGRRAEAAEKYGLRVYESHQEMLGREKLDAVYICLPPHAHDGQELEIVRRGLALFVEKPVCLDLSYAQRTADAITRSGVINAVGYMCRYLDVVEEAKALIGTSPVIVMRGFYYGPLPPTPWWRRAELSGGQIIEQATHVVDLMRYLAGEADRVTGEAYHGAMTENEGYNVDDASSVNIRFRGGAIANLTCACVLAKQYCPGLEIVTKGRRLWLDLPPRPVKLVQLDGVDLETDSGHDRFIREDQAFVAAVAGHDQRLIRSDYADAAKTLALTLAMQRAVETGDTVRL